MTHQIIKTDNYLLVVEAGIKEGERGLSINNAVYTHAPHLGEDYGNQIIYHLPLNNAPTLEGVPLLPPLEDDVELAYQKELLTDNQDKNWVGYGKGINGVSKERWKSIYSKAKEEYKYTEEDVRKAIEMARELDGLHFKNGAAYKIIQSLQQPKYPVSFECEMEFIDNHDFMDFEEEATTLPGSIESTEQPKTITNSQGLTQVVGKYIYETS